MSHLDQLINKKYNKQLSQQQTKQKIYTTSHKQTKQSLNQYKNLMMSQHLRKSSFNDEQFNEKEQQKQYTYNMLQSNYQKRVIKGSQKKEQKNTPAYQSEHQEYESISSDKSDKQERNKEIKLSQQEGDLNKVDLGQKKYSNLIQDKKQSQYLEKKIHIQEDVIRSYRPNYLASFEQQNRATNTNISRKNFSSSQKQFKNQILQKSSQNKPMFLNLNLQQNKKISETQQNTLNSGQKQTYLKQSIPSRKFDKQLSLQKKQELKLSSRKMEIQEQSLNKSNNSKYPSVSFLVQSKHQASKRSFKASNQNSPQTELKINSKKYNESVVISSGFQNPAQSKKHLFQDKVHFIQSSIRKKEQKTDQVHFITSQQRRQKQANNQVQYKNKEPQSKQKNSSLFYVSISEQAMYPSLDLKNKAKQLSQQNKQKIVQVDKNINPTRSMKPSQKVVSKKLHTPQLPQSIKILTYRSQFFMKIQTQIFTIKVKYEQQQPKQIELKNIKNPSNTNQQNQQQTQNPKNYQIQRRFSDFVFLYESIITNHLGYIIYPFPQKTLQSFIKIKLQSIIGGKKGESNGDAESQKAQLIEKRIQELEKFVNFILEHEELRYCEEVAIFLCEDFQLYQKSKIRIQKYVQQYQQLQSTNSIVQQGKKNIRKALESSFGKVKQWWGSGQDKADINQKLQKSKILRQTSSSNNSVISEFDIQFGQYYQKLSIYYSKFQILQHTLLKFIQTQQKFIQFRDIDTELDYLVKLCTKVSSGKEYHKYFIQAITIQMIKDVEIFRKWLGQTKLQLEKREELKQLIEKLKESYNYGNENSTKISKLERRLQRFEKNFREGFGNLLIKSGMVFQQSKQKFIKLWQKHSKNMKKVWK